MVKPMHDNNSPKPTKHGMSLPGQPTEEAVAEVGTEAGKSLLRGLGRLGNTWISEKEARSAAAKLSIETESKIAAAKAVVAAQREQELADVEHQALLHRRAERLKIEFQREQANLEAIETKAIEFTEGDPDSKAADEIDEDWLFKFADLAQRVSNNEVQELWARVLSSAAIKNAPLLSAQALQTLGMFDKHAAEDFQKLVFVISQLGFFPCLDQNRQQDPQKINLAALIDLGLVQTNASSDLYRFPGFLMNIGTSNLGLNLLKDRIFLTKRGADIANAVFRRSEFNPGEHVINEYIRLTAQKEIYDNKAVSIFIDAAGGSASKAFMIEQKTTNENEAWRLHRGYLAAGPHLKSLLDWAGIYFSITTF